MKQQIQSRVDELKAELETGHQMLQDLDEKRSNLGYTITRISGAIQALEELLAREEEAQ
jgi:peptidoglycan hydrolase CwlO-like protein